MSNLLQFPPSNSSEGLSDADARLHALDTHISCIVEAPAGSGKTGLLMQRYLKLLADPAVTQPEEVLAITFTNKATAELRERVVKQLEAAEHNTPLPETASPFDRATRDFAAAALAHDKQLAWNVLGRPQRLNIRTIDSICASIANSLPVLSGAGGSLRPATDAAPLYRLAAERTLMQLGGSDRALHEALYTILLHRDASLADVESLIASMLTDREQWGELIPLDPSKLTDEHLETHTRLELERTLETIVCRTLTRTANLLPPRALDELASMAAELGWNEGYKDEPNPFTSCSNISGPPSAVAEHLDHWKVLISLLLTGEGKWRSGFNVNHIYVKVTQEQKSRLKGFVDSMGNDALLQALREVQSLPPARYPEHQWLVTKSLFHVLRRALIELQLVFAEHGTCDFTELSIAARQALATSDEDDSADLALTPGGSLRHLLVDEMQDTSAAQYELIQRLTHTWDGATQTLFLVGDPKQSIYLFRQARVERFLRTMREQRLGDVPLRALHLTANFRSQADLVTACNDTFSQLFPSPEEAARTHNNSDVPYIQAVPTRPRTEDVANIDFHASIPEDDFPSAPKESLRTLHEQQQATLIRATIEHWLARPFPPDRPRDKQGNPKPWTIAILARARHHFGPIVAELKRSHIPYRAIDIDPLTTRQEILDILALTRALLHPADRVAWLAVLRAPWCGLSLADLLALTGEGPAADASAPIAELIPLRRTLLSLDGQSQLDRVWPLLSAAHTTLGSEPFAVHVERTWRSLGGDAILSPEQRTNVMRFFKLLTEVAAEDTFVDLALLTRRLQSLYAEPTSEDTSIELLTIHKAKGLEWDVVLVPSLERPSMNASSDLLNWLEVDDTGEGGASVLIAPIGGRGSSDTDLLNDWLRKARNARELAEMTRLFYVLATRAKEELHLFGAAKRGKSGILQPANSSLLKAIWPIASQIFEELSQPGTIHDDLAQSLLDDDFAAPELALAASASQPAAFISRVPANFNPSARFLAANTNRLPYTPAEQLQQGPTFIRPEGSFAVRAFGNVVHRYLQIMANALHSTSFEDLARDLDAWQPRLHTSFRGEGLSPSLAETEARRALEALHQVLRDPRGRWLLSPQPNAFTERPIALATQTLRVDRTFVAGPDPLSDGHTHTWIVDFKTSTSRGLTDAAFEAEERAKYGPQLATYAAAARALTPQGGPIILALYYPLLPRLLFWTSSV